MKWFGGMNRGLVYVFLGLAISLPIGVCPAADALFETIPADSLFCVRINNMDAALGQLDQFIMGISPMPLSLAMMAKMQMATFLGDPELSNVNMAGSFGAFAIKSGEDDVLFAVLVPVTDFDKFLAGHSNISKPDNMGVYAITQGQGQTDPTIVFVRSGSYLLLTEPGMAEPLAAWAAGFKANRRANLTSSLDAATVAAAAKEPMWAYANLQKIKSQFGDAIDEVFDGIRSEMGNNPMMPGASAQSMEMGLQIVEAFMDQSDWISLSLRPSGEAFGASMKFKALANSDLAGMLIAAPAGKLALTEYLEDGAMMNMAFRVNKDTWAKSNTWMLDIMTAGTDDDTKADLAKVKTMIASMGAAMGESMAFTMKASQGQSPFTGTMAMQIQDEAAYRKAMKEMEQVSQSGSIKRLYEAFGMKADFALKAAAEEYSGVKIDVAKVSIEGMGDPQADQAIKAIYGEGFNYRLAVVKGLCLGAIGGTDAAMKTMIDEAKAGKAKTTASEIKAAMTMLGGDASKLDYIGTYNIVRLFAMSMPMMQTMMPGGTMPKINIESKSNIVFGGTIGNGAMTFDLIAPKAHILEMMTMAQQMSQQMAPHGQPNQDSDR